MKIQFCVPSYIPFYNAGSEWYVHGLALRLASRGHDVSVISTISPLDRCHRRTIDGVDCNYTANVAEARKIAQTFEPDIAFSQFDVLTDMLIRYKAEWNCKVGVILHHFNAFENINKRGQFDKVDLFVANSNYLQKLVGAKCITLWPPIVRERVVGKKSGDKITLINLLPEKGAEIFYALAEKHPELEFVGVVGGYQKLKQLRKTSLKNVSIFENIKEVARYYEETRILLMPSKIESFGMVGVEAQMNGIPVIAADLPELHESLCDGAIFCKSFDDYDNALTEVENNYAELSVAAVKNALIKAETIERQVDEFELACKELCNV